MSIGNKIVSLRNMNNMTQEDLAVQIGLSANVVSALEKDLIAPDLPTLNKVAEVFNLSIDDLLSDNDDIGNDISHNQDVETSIVTKTSTTKIKQKRKSIADEDELDRTLGLDSKPTLQNIRCQSCGSSDIQLHDDYATCNNCGAKILIDKNVTNNFITNVSLNNEKIDDHFIIDTIATEKDFLKSVYYLLTVQKTPADVLDNTTFGKVEKCEAQFLEIDAHYNGNYSASVGYDRKEEYTTREKVYDPELHMEITKPVIKEKVVTDWRPVSGPISIYQKSYIQLGVEHNEVIDSFANTMPKDIDYLNTQGNIKPINENNAKNIKFKIPTTDEINKAVSSAKTGISYMTEYNLKSTGDQFKDFRCNLSHTINKKNYYIATQYSVDYVYHDSTNGNDIKCHSIGPGYKKNDARGTYPDATKDISGEINSKTHFSGVFSILASLFAMLFCGYLIFFSPETRNLPFIAVAVVIAIIAFVFYRIRHRKIEKEINVGLLEMKKWKLISRLEKEGLPPLTSEELQAIENLKEGV